MILEKHSEATVGWREKPQNGWAGLKYWKHDLRSGFMVALISLPFSMGIAITSGAPPVCGITSAIIAGFILPFMGGSYMTISGPAAGLAPALFAGMITLGGGDLAVGYPRVLAAICITGVVQLLLAQFKVARLSAIFPAAAIEGMLAAIGLMIIVKQVPLFFGVSFEGHDFWEILEEMPARASAIEPQVIALGLGCTALIFALAAIPLRIFKVMPPAVWAFVVGTVLAQCFLDLRPQDLIHVPEAPLANGIVMPDFAGIINNSDLWFSLGILVLTLVLIDGTESLATISAVDKIDPYRRKSNPDRTLSAMGVSNVASSMVGGLTIIPGIVKSTANILGGGRTQWANFYNACFLLLMLLFGRELIDMVPKAVLASILVFVGYKLCRPAVWSHMAKVGREQLFIFTTTVLVTVTTDLLLGIIAGVGIKFALCLWHHRLSGAEGSLVSAAVDLVRNPIGRRVSTGDQFDLYAERPMVCFNLFHMIREMDRIPVDARTVTLHITDSVSIVDHTTCEALLHFQGELNSLDGKPNLEIVGLDRMRVRSEHASATHLAPRGAVGMASAVSS